MSSRPPGSEPQSRADTARGGAAGLGGQGRPGVPRPWQCSGSVPSLPAQPGAVLRPPAQGTSCPPWNPPPSRGASLPAATQCPWGRPPGLRPVSQRCHKHLAQLGGRGARPPRTVTKVTGVGVTRGGQGARPSSRPAPAPDSPRSALVGSGTAVAGQARPPAMP